MYVSSSCYSQLAPDPLPPGPRVTNPVAPVLRLLLRGFNAALAVLSLLLIGYAIWMWRAFRHSGGAPPPAPDPVLLLHHGKVAPLAGALLQPAVAAFPWFIYLLGMLGVYCFCTAMCGLSGVKRERRSNLAAFIALLALLVLAEAAATLLLLTDNGWRDKIPDDPSGRWRQALEELDAYPRTARLTAVSLLVAELVVLAAACWLHAIYTAAYEAWLDDREEQSERAREVLARAVVQTYGGSGAPWSSRLRNKYGLEASTIEATTLAARQAAALRGDGPNFV